MLVSICKPGPTLNLLSGSSTCQECTVLILVKSIKFIDSSGLRAITSSEQCQLTSPSSDNFIALN
jgi:hypothetical protein